ncbi:MAG: exopolysaccharide biosynthesis polyprenyl glycosylphosphotransferase [Lachnospiraceae bacterium]|jgi:exopolysaccharide biosynthesis polyprenyl glycosylphosphotransferase|nr:exopolysaccharide biosynthesis polyprenyl glycosylphosphotransferase [Lachnospiraceae bacterium]
MEEITNNSSFEQYKRIVKFVGSAVIVLVELAVYFYAWMNWYNTHMTIAFYRRGNWLIAGEYFVLLLFFHRMYGGLKVGIYRYWNLVYSHMISIIGINVFFYVQVVLFDKKMHNPAGMLVVTLVDLILVMIWAGVFRRVYRFLFPRKRLLLVHSKMPMFQLMNRIGTREDKYEIVKTVSIDKGIERIVAESKAYDGVIIGDIPAESRNKLMKRCYALNIRSYTVPKISDILLRTSIELNIFDAPLYLSRNYDGLAWDQRCIKRLEDILVSGLLLLLTSPLFILITAAIKCTDKGPAFFTQQRLTKDGKVFSIYKFRTMIVDAEKKSGPVKAEDKDPRILPIGHFLRATRLDELPQLLNILKGDMSFVGPRPERPELAKIITKNIPEFEYRLKVKAGLTGYAQIYGKYCTTSYDKLKLDLTYIRNYSILLDFKLILMTPKILFMKESTEGFEEGKWEDPALKES